MESKTQHGYLVLADISGYTSYLAGTELEHAHEILTALLETIVLKFKTLLTVSKLEGDAVFAYALENAVPRGELLLDLVESTYVAFRDHVTAAHRRTTCTCNACRNIPNLDLKFMAHHGDYIIQEITGIKELVGSDVNLVHRLLKNHVAEATGWHAYALFTGQALAHIGVQFDDWHAQPETYEHLGEVQTHSLNLRERYQTLVEARRAFISAEEADLVIIQDFPAPPSRAWDWMNNPLQRNKWAAGHGVEWRAGDRPQGRTGPGARNHCNHGQGKGEGVETILDWRPFDYVTIETLDGGILITETMQFEPLPDGATRFHDHLTVKMPPPRFLRRAVTRLIMLNMMKYDQLIAIAAHLLGEELAREKSSA